LVKFYLSEDLEILSKEEAKKRVISKGGIIREDITNDIWYFVTNNPKNGSEAFRKANKLGLLFINENEFIKMLD
jgi:NAD-dependent DNA ligase